MKPLTRASVVFVAAMAACASPDYTDHGENFGQYEIETLIDSLVSEFDAAEHASGFRASGRLDGYWMIRIRNWEAARQQLFRKAGALKNQALVQAVGNVVIRPMLGRDGTQRIRDLRAAQMKMEMVERVFDTLEE